MTLLTTVLYSTALFIDAECKNVIYVPHVVKHVHCCTVTLRCTRL